MLNGQKVGKSMCFGMSHLVARVFYVSYVSSTCLVFFLYACMHLTWSYMYFSYTVAEPAALFRRGNSQLIIRAHVKMLFNAWSLQYRPRPAVAEPAWGYVSHLACEAICVLLFPIPV